MAKKKTATVEEVVHSKKFYLVKGYYPEKWGKKAVYNAVGRGWITAAEYEEITGEVYEA